MTLSASSLKKEKNEKKLSECGNLIAEDVLKRFKRSILIEGNINIMEEQTINEVQKGGLNFKL